MNNLFSSFKSNLIAVSFLTLSFVLIFTDKSLAQDEAAIIDTVVASDPHFESLTAGEFTPGKGFTLIETDFGSLNISGYGLARYINQLPAEQSFEDHLGRKRVIDTRQDIMWHRTFLWASGFLATPKLRYSISVWGLTTTNQTLVFGYLQYQLMKELRIGVGIGPNAGSRSMMGSWPLFLSSDRVMAEEFFRPGFTSGIWIQGEVLPRFYYHLMLGNNLSQLGTTASNLTRDLSTSGTVWWMPTTGEFGLRGGYGDFEIHEEVATRFGASFTHMREDRQTPIDIPTPNETQVKISDGIYFFETGALAQDVTVKQANFDLLAIDAGVKHNGWHLQVEYYFRNLSKFDLYYHTESAIAPNYSSIYDHGFYASLSYELIPKLLQVYSSTSWIFDQFKRNPWEVVGGMSLYPARSRAWRINMNLIYIEKSPASSSFGFYQGGLNGPILSMGTDFMF
jgi:hypothetical protein